MATSPSDLVRAASAPYSAEGGIREFDLDTSDDSITLAAGVHEIYNSGPSLAFVRLGSSLSALSDKAAEVSSQYVVPVGGSIVIALASDTAVHAMVASATAILYITRRGSL